MGLIDHVVAVVKLLPVVSRLHLHLLLVHFLHLLLLGHLVVVVDLAVHLLLLHFLLLLLLILGKSNKANG